MYVHASYIIHCTCVCFQCLGQLAVVLKVMPSDDVRIAVCGNKWVMNPRCLVPAPDEVPPTIMDGR